MLHIYQISNNRGSTREHVSSKSSSWISCNVIWEIPGNRYHTDTTHYLKCPLGWSSCSIPCITLRCELQTLYFIFGLRLKVIVHSKKEILNIWLTPWSNLLQKVSNDQPLPKIRPNIVGQGSGWSGKFIQVQEYLSICAAVLIGWLNYALVSPMCYILAGSWSTRLFDAIMKDIME